jgi:hypothetical protein
VAEDRTTQFSELYRIGASTLRPEPIVFYKPKKTGDGVAAKFNLTLRPVYDPEDGFVKEVDGGLFLDLVAQGDTNAAGFPTFKWTDRDTLITAKFGLPDVSGLLAAIRDFRVRGIEVATYLRGKDKTKGNVVSFFHKSGAADTTAITYTFDAESSAMRLSKSREKSRSVSLTLGEELILQKYLEFALDAFVRVGLR